MVYQCFSSPQIISISLLCAHKRVAEGWRARLAAGAVPVLSKSNHALKCLKSQPFSPFMSRISSDPVCKTYYQGRSVCFEISAATEEVALQHIKRSWCLATSQTCTVPCNMLSCLMLRRHMRKKTLYFIALNSGLSCC